MILQNFPEADLVEVSSTTKAAMLAKKYEKDGAAAMGGPLAAEMHGLKMIDECIQDSATNTTRFLIIGEKTCPPTGDDRTSLLFSTKDKPGSLLRALEVFDSISVNMSKIESRPSKQRDWEYNFYVDLAGHSSDETISDGIEKLSEFCSMVKILGSYPDVKDSR